MAALVPPVIIKATSRHTATLIFLHGLGDTGMGWAGALNTIRPAYMKVICPTAPVAPVTINGGMTMPSWYDIRSLNASDEDREDMEGVESARTFLNGLIDGEVNNSAIERERIVVGGFSQGGAVALYTAMRDEGRLGACLALSTYVPGADKLEERAAKSEVPVLQCHGDSDEVVPIERGKQAHEILKKYFAKIEFEEFANMGHEATLPELDSVKEFINKYVPEK